MSFSVEIPVANIASANSALDAAGFGAENFNIPIWTTSSQPTIAVAYCLATMPELQAACVALPGATVREYGQIDTRIDDTATAAGGRWGANAPLLQGNVTPGLYRAVEADGGALWMVIQAFNRTTFNLPLNGTTNPYPALLTPAREPGVRTIWVQPLGAFDAYYVVNPFNGEPDRVTDGGLNWVCTQQSAAGGINTFQPGVFGWTQE